MFYVDRALLGTPWVDTVSAYTQIVKRVSNEEPGTGRKGRGWRQVAGLAPRSQCTSRPLFLYSLVIFYKLANRMILSTHNWLIMIRYDGFMLTGSTNDVPAPTELIGPSCFEDDHGRAKHFIAHVINEK